MHTENKDSHRILIGRNSDKKVCQFLSYHQIVKMIFLILVLNFALVAVDAQTQDIMETAITEAANEVNARRKQNQGTAPIGENYPVQINQILFHTVRFIFFVDFKYI